MSTHMFSPSKRATGTTERSKDSTCGIYKSASATHKTRCNSILVQLENSLAHFHLRYVQVGNLDCELFVERRKVGHHLRFRLRLRRDTGAQGAWGYCFMFFLPFPSSFPFPPPRPPRPPLLPLWPPSWPRSLLSLFCLLIYQNDHLRSFHRLRWPTFFRYWFNTETKPGTDVSAAGLDLARLHVTAVARALGASDIE